MNFNEAFEILIGHEGNYVNNPNDPGGETKYGISKRSYPYLNIRDLTLSQAKEIYKRDFWDRLQLDRFPKSMRFQLFDGAVNSGVGNAARWLQRAVGTADDGWIGPITLTAVENLKECQLLLNYNAERLTFMTKLSTWKHFGKGWARRIAQNLKTGAKDIGDWNL